MRISPLLQGPWVSSAIFRIDWLHCADQGISADTLGNLFRLLAGKCEGGTISQRTTALWEKVQSYYVTHEVQDRLQNLVPSMLKQPTKPAKLRCSAAQCRALIPFADQCAQELLSSAAPVEAAAKAAIHHLHECYKALSTESIFSCDTLRRHSIRFALQYCALQRAHEEVDPSAWRVKPKLHLFLEVCSEGSRPAMCWTYRDEDYGGSVARMSRRRGGALSVKAFSSNLLQRFRLQQPVLRMVP